MSCYLEHRLASKDLYTKCCLDSTQHRTRPSNLFHLEGDLSTQDCFCNSLAPTISLFLKINSLSLYSILLSLGEEGVEEFIFIVDFLSKGIILHTAIEAYPKNTQMPLRPVTCSAPKCPSYTRKWFLRSLAFLLSFFCLCSARKICLLCKSARFVQTNVTTAVLH
ncbi:hypothetical protein CEXT_519091 [Caerostris extrusa]|uniref:Uncharacterized protein n=1 Tax=Caerostris extrusa TaxID=172846 RepID=A0AAV4RIB5_CAEEX|nr:hypothetical protein CEXT_519091 [Caerostris extrusa]